MGHPMKSSVTTIALFIALLLTAKAQQFTGTSVNLKTGHVSAITGTINGGIESVIQSVNYERPRTEIYQEIIDRLRSHRLQLQASTDRAWAEMANARLEYELRQQTELLRKIANKP